MPPPADRIGRLRPWAACLCIGVVALAAYATGLHGAFVYDDIPAIADNPSLRQLDAAALFPPPGATTTGRPVLNLSLAANYAVGGLNVTGYHWVNLGVHAAAGMLLFGLLRRTLARPCLAPRFGPAGGYLALLIALLWTAHPLQTEAVTYVVQRAESLMGLFFFGTWYGFARSLDSPAPARWLTASVAACCLGMATKEVMVVAPVVVLLHDRTFGAGSFAAAWRARSRYYVALAGTWCLLVVLVASTGWNRGGTIGPGVGVSWGAYVITQFRALAHYLRLAAWPHPLVFDYGTLWERNVAAVLPYALLVVGAVVAVGMALRLRPALGFAGAVCLLPLATTSLAPGTTQMIVEHRLYVSLAPALAIVVLGTYRLAGRRVLGVWALSAIAMVVATAARNRVYASPATLWADTVAKAPHNARAHCNLAVALVQRGRVTEALPHYETSLHLAPGAANTHFNYALALVKIGRAADALPEYEAALALDPAYVDARCNFGNALLSTGRTTDALHQYERALALRRDDPDLLGNTGAALAQLGRRREAILHFRRALALRPADADLRYNLATALFAEGDRSGALHELETADRLRPGDPDILNNLRLIRRTP